MAESTRQESSTRGLQVRKIPIAEPEVSRVDIEYVTKALRSGWISGKGIYVDEFERRFAEWVGAEYAIATSSGTSALHLALAALGIGAGDEVIIPAFSMIAIPFAVSYTGARSRLVDSEDLTWNMDPPSVEEKLTRKTRAIVAMHTYGHPVDMDPIMDIAGKHELHVLEDAAEAHGAEYKGRKVGTIGEIGCFSFYSNKIITTGEGGMVVTSDSKLAARARLLRDMAFGKDSLHRFEHQCVAYNYRLTNIQAALGLAQLERVEHFIEERRARAKVYDDLLGSLEGIRLPPEASWAKNVYWMYSILVDEKDYGLNRDRLIERLGTRGIETRPFFVPVHQQPAYAELYRSEAYPESEMLARTGLNLPSGNTLTVKQVECVAKTIASLCRR